MPAIESLISGSEKLIEVFGYWPSFHDAEVIELHFWRGDVDADRESYVFPVLTVKLHAWELTNEVDNRGFLILRYHTLTTLRFHDVDEFKMEGFNHQNAVFGLRIQQLNYEDGPSPLFAVNASFRCSRVEVVDAMPCTLAGAALPQ